MKSMHRILAVTLVLAALSACAHAPRSLQMTDHITSIRMQFLADYPNGRFNDQIQRGEIAKGMNVLEVLAAWGTPVDKARVEGVEVETWTYRDRDEHSRDFIIYEVVFDKRLLTDWFITRSTAGAGGTFASGASGYASYRESRKDPAVTRPRVETGVRK
jgi:hypothetical protein